MQDATTWQDWVLVGGTIVSAVAAVVAIIYARRTVGEARALRREDRLDRLSQLVIDYGTVIQTHLVVGVAADQFPALRTRLRGAIATAGVPLPACAALLALDRSSEGKVIIERMSAALDELARVATGRTATP